MQSNQITKTQHTKVVTLNPSRNTLPLGNHTKSIDLEHLRTHNKGFKKVLIHISFRFNNGMDQTLFYPDPTQTQQQYQPFVKHLGFGFFKALDHF